MDSLGKSGYGTAGYVGDGYFITVKHAVVALDDDDGARKITSVTLRYKGQDIAATSWTQAMRPSKSIPATGPCSK